MNLDARYRRAACLLILLGVTSYTTAAQTPLLGIVAVPVILAAWWLTSGPGPKAALPRWAVNLLVLGALLLAFYRAARQGLDVSGVAELVMLLQLIKLGDRRGPRDDAQLLSLAVFLAIAAMLTSNDFWVGVQLIVFLPVLVLAVMLFQLRSGQERFAGAVRRALGPDGAAAPVAAGKRMAAGLRGTAGFSLLGALAIAVFVFIFMPRGIGERFFGQWSLGRPSQVTGFTDQVRLGTGGVISESSEVVMDVRVTTESGESLGAADQFQYLRGSVLERYEGGVWTARDAADPRRSPASQVLATQQVFLAGEDPQAPADVVQHIAIRNPSASGQAVFTLWRPLRVEFASDGRLARDDATRTLKVYPDRAPRPPDKYTVWSATLEAGPTPTRRRPNVGFDSPAIFQRATEIVQEAGLDPDPLTRPIEDDARVARAIEAHLRTNYQYTLAEEAAGAGTDPIEHFLFTTRRGHCEYFASAMAAMCRSVGVNARIAVGFLAAEYNGAADVYTVRASNAHAWVEAEVGVARWRRFDPTPAGELVRLHRPRLGLLGRARQWLDAVEFLWNTRVVSFDERARERLLRADGSGSPGLLARFDRLLARVRAGGPRLVADAVGFGGLVFIVLAAAGSVTIAILRRGPRARRAARAGPFRRRSDPALQARLAHAAFYEQLLRVLARRGLAKPVWKPPLDHARTLASADAPLARAVGELAMTYYRVRFRGDTLADRERSDAESIVKRLAAGPRRS